MPTLHFRVQGMDCSECALRLHQAISTSPGSPHITQVSVSAMTNIATITFAESSASSTVKQISASLLTLASSLGFPMKEMGDGAAANLSMDIRKSETRGLNDFHLAEKITEINGVQLVKISKDLHGQNEFYSFVVEYNPMVVGARGILASVPGSVLCTHTVKDDQLKTHQTRMTVAAVVTCLTIVLKYFIPVNEDLFFDLEYLGILNDRMLVLMIMATGCLHYFGSPLMKSAYGAFKHSRSLTMDTLVSISSGVAYIYAVSLLVVSWAGINVDGMGDPPFETVSILLGLVAIGREIEASAKRKTAKALESLASLQSFDAMLISPGSVGEKEILIPCCLNHRQKATVTMRVCALGVIGRCWSCKTGCCRAGESVVGCSDECLLAGFCEIVTIRGCSLQMIRETAALAVERDGKGGCEDGCCSDKKEEEEKKSCCDSGSCSDKKEEKSCCDKKDSSCCSDKKEEKKKSCCDKKDSSCCSDKKESTKKQENKNESVLDHRLFPSSLDLRYGQVLLNQMPQENRFFLFPKVSSSLFLPDIDVVSPKPIAAAASLPPKTHHSHSHHHSHHQSSTPPTTNASPTLKPTHRSPPLSSTPSPANIRHSPFSFSKIPDPTATIHEGDTNGMDVLNLSRNSSFVRTSHPPTLFSRLRYCLFPTSYQPETSDLLELQEVFIPTTLPSQISPNLLHINDIVEVCPSQHFPADGVIIFGSTHSNEAIVTGEQRHIPKGVGDSVIGGSMNGDGLVHVRVTALPGMGIVSRIISLVESAQAERPKIQSVADTVSMWFTPFILVSGIVTFFAWTGAAYSGIVDTGDLSPIPFALQFALSLIVVSCPCAIALAAPTAVMVATSVATKYGLLLKSGVALETMTEIKHIVFDKTGTVTTGELEVKKVAIISSLHDGDIISSLKIPHDVQSACEQQGSLSLVMAVAAAVSHGSSHPLSVALCNHCKSLNIPFHQIKNVERTAVPGKGIRATLNGTRILLGSPAFMQEHQDLMYSWRQKGPFLMETHLSIVCIAVGTKIWASIGLADTVRPEAYAIIQCLISNGIQVWLASGDTASSVIAVADTLRIPVDHARGELTPETKSEMIAILQGDGKNKVAMVGDGVNDAVALSRADVGIAIAAGAAVAMDCADLVIKSPNLQSILTFLKLSQETKRRIKINFFWAIVYNSLAMPLAAGVLYPKFGTITIPPAFAGLGELFSSVPVVLGSLLLYRFQP